MVNEISALLIAPNREMADQFNATVAQARAFRVVGDLKSYPSAQTLDMRLRQLRPSAVILDLATNLEEACDLIKTLTAQTPPVHVIGLHTSNDSQVILRALRAGASEFLYAPFEVSIQEAAVARIQRLLQPESAEEQVVGKVVVFASTKPGSGASTLAVQTAFALRRNTGKRVLLLDFDLLGGTAGFYLRLDQSYSIVDVLLSCEKLDAALWSSMISHSSGLEVLPAPDLPYSELIDPDRLHDVLQYAKTLYDWVIVDLPCIFHRISLLTLPESDKAFLVANSELASLHLARKAVKLLFQLGFDSKRFQVLINRVDKRDGMNSSDLGKLFDCDVDASLPNDYFALHRVVTLGEPLAGDTELGRAVEVLAAKLKGALPPPEARRAAAAFVLKPAHVAS